MSIEQELERRKVYQAMIAQAMQQSDPYSVVSGRVVPNPMGGLSKIAKAYMGRKGLDQSIDKERIAEEQAKIEQSAANQRVMDTAFGRPSGIVQLPGTKPGEELDDPELYQEEKSPNLKRAALMAATDPNLRGSGISNVLTALLNREKETEGWTTLNKEELASSGYPPGSVIQRASSGEEKVIIKPEQDKPQNVWTTLKPEEVAMSGYQKGTVVQRNEQGLEQVKSKPEKSLSSNDITKAKSKYTQLSLLKKQLSTVQDYFNKIKNTNQAGPFIGTASKLTQIGGDGQSFDKAVDAMRGTLTAILRTPGVGSMSDYETKLDQAKMPDRGIHETSTQVQLDELNKIVDELESGYLGMLGDDAGLSEEAPQEPKKSKYTVTVVK